MERYAQQIFDELVDILSTQPVNQEKLKDHAFLSTLLCFRYPNFEREYTRLLVQLLPVVHDTQ